MIFKKSSDFYNTFCFQRQYNFYLFVFGNVFPYSLRLNLLYLRNNLSCVWFCRQIYAQVFRSVLHNCAKFLLLLLPHIWLDPYTGFSEAETNLTNIISSSRFLMKLVSLEVTLDFLSRHTVWIPSSRRSFKLTHSNSSRLLSFLLSNWPSVVILKTQSILSPFSFFNYWVFLN